MKVKAMTENNAENTAPQLEKELDADPASTYGASEAYKAAWHAKFGGDAAFDAPTAGDSTAGDSTPVSNDGTGQAPAAGEAAPANAGVNDVPADPAADAPQDDSAKPKNR